MTYHICGANRPITIPVKRDPEAKVNLHEEDVADGYTRFTQSEVYDKIVFMVAVNKNGNIANLSVKKRYR